MKGKILMARKRARRGFTTTKLLVGVVVVVLAAGAWYFLHSHINEPTVANNVSFETCKTAKGSRLLETYPVVCITAKGQRFTKPVTTPSAPIVTDVESFGDCTAVRGTITDNYPRTCTYGDTTYVETVLTIKEWGIGVVIPFELRDAYYQISPTDPNVAYLSSKQLAAAAPDCAPDKTSVGAYFRQTPAEYQAATANSNDTSPPAQLKVGDYYYGYIHAQADCADTPDGQTLIQEWQPAQAFADALKSIQAIK